VIAAAGSDARVKAGLALGADHGVNYNREDLHAEVMRFTGGKGVDVLYDNIANPKVLPGAFRAIGFGGRLVTAGAHGGPDVTIDFAHLYHKQITIKGRPGYHPPDVPKCFAAAAEGKVTAQIERRSAPPGRIGRIPRQDRARPDAGIESLCFFVFSFGKPPWNHAGLPKPKLLPIFRSLPSSPMKSGKQLLMPIIWGFLRLLGIGRFDR